MQIICHTLGKWTSSHNKHKTHYIVKIAQPAEKLLKIITNSLMNCLDYLCHKLVHITYKVVMQDNICDIHFQSIIDHFGSLFFTHPVISKIGFSI